jgi:hypothetical protein
VVNGQAGNLVYFSGYEAIVVTGSNTFAAGGTGVVASFSTGSAGIVPVDTFIPQTTWNVDPANGSGTLPLLDTTKGNVYSAEYQYLGYGMVSFYIENPTTGRLAPVHRIEYANANTQTSLRNPTLPLSVIASNGANSSALRIAAGSMASFIQGEIDLTTGTVRNSAAVARAVTTTELAVLSIRTSPIFGGRTNKFRVFLDNLAFANESTSKNSTFRVYINAPLVGAPVWTQVDSTFMYKDTSLTESRPAAKLSLRLSLGSAARGLCINNP